LSIVGVVVAKLLGGDAPNKSGVEIGKVLELNLKIFYYKYCMAKRNLKAMKWFNT